MAYYFAKTLEIGFDDAVARVENALKEQGFGVLTRIDVQHTLKQKLGVEFPRYLILGACNPTLAHEALQVENKIGTMLPCNVVVRDNGAGYTEIAAIDPVISMQGVNNPQLINVATGVRAKLKSVVSGLASGH